MRTVVRILIILLAVIILAAAGYASYVLISYHRIGDMPLTAEGAVPEEGPQAGTEYSILSYNIGFGAYEADYGFFMDGGTESWAWSEQRLEANLQRIADLLENSEADILLLQETDIGSTRTYQLDEREYLLPPLRDRACVFAQNYDSPFLFYPFRQPHGASRSGIMVISSFPITSAERVELPVADDLTKLLDLDRCYVKTRTALPDGRELVIYNFHLSAYSSDGTIATEQLRLLLSDMESEYGQGNCCIAGGDFNKDILGNASEIFGAVDGSCTWAQPIPEGIFEGSGIVLEAPIDEDDPVPSCRNADGPYAPGQMVLTVDGFLVSGNVHVTESTVIDTGFAMSDHNPVTMRFILRPEPEERE